MADAPVTAGVLARLLYGVENRLTARIDVLSARVDDAYGHIDGLHHRLDRLDALQEEIRILEKRLER